MSDHRVGEVEASVRAAAERLGLTDRTVLAGVSGGPDSVCLLYALARVGVKVQAGWVDHGLRAGSAAEGDLVAAHCRTLGVGFAHERVTVAAGAGLEAAAREARYAALERMRLGLQLDVVATGHTASDQAETVLMRLGRGTALGGAAGILEQRGDGVVRPMLSVTRVQTRAYVEALGLATVADPMNEDPAFTRVRVRNEVLPALSAALGPGAERALSRFASMASEDEGVLMAQAATALARAVLPGGALDRVAVLSLERPIQRRVMALFLEQAAVPIDAELIASCLSSIARSATATLPMDLLLVVEAGEVSVRQAPPRTR